MNGAQDMGGMHGLRARGARDDEPRLPRRLGAPGAGADARHARRLATWNLDGARFARESLPPLAVPLRHATTRSGSRRSTAMLEDTGWSAPRTRGAGPLAAPARRPIDAAPLAAEATVPTLGRGGPTVREADAPARFAVGDRVRARNEHPATHTRLPRYVRGHEGTVALVHGCHIFPDTHAHGLGEQPEWLYTVRFDGRELWGPAADPTVRVSTDAFEPYLEPVA